MDYKDTVNLPKTEFAMRANLTQREPAILDRWDAMDLYGCFRKIGEHRPKYVLHDGPPYANGELHLGHALNKILKDFVVKSKQMAGFDAPFVPGWDCHGLPIEYRVLSELGEGAKTLTQTEVRQRCRAFALRYVDIHREGFKRLGVTGDWGNPYLTLSSDYVATIIRTFAEMYLSGCIYRGLKPIYWCASCETALAEAEVEYANHTSPSVYVKFEAMDPIPDVEGPANYVIWTTTPWTLPANLAICLHPDFEYCAVRAQDETLIMASYLAPHALAACGIASYHIQRKFSAKELEGLTYRHCLYPTRSCPIILGEHVTLDAGTGCVHTAPGHGQEDYIVGARYGLNPFSPVDDRGVFTSEAGPYAGMSVFEANAKIVDDLRASGRLLHTEEYEHSYPHCWRCACPVLYRSTPQWFVSLEANALRERALAAVDSATWIPAWGQERIRSMIAQRPDWCISRQRAWGVPIPVFYCEQCDEVLATPESFRSAEAVALAAANGIDRWFDSEASALLPEGTRCVKCGGTRFRQEKDILDVWFDSGVSHRAVCEKRPDLTWPADMYLEGSDQHRGWFQLSLIPAVAVKGAAPYRTVLTHGYVVDGEGRAMSKKLGNYVELSELLNTYGADIIRLWVASENYRLDIRVSEEILKRQEDAYRRIRNTFRFMLGNLSDFGPDDHVSYAQLEDVDRWTLHQAQLLKHQLLAAYSDCDFHTIYHSVYNFCTVDLSAFYLDILKDRLYTFAADCTPRRAAQTVLAEVLADLLKLLAPILVYTCDEAWQHLPAHLKTSDSVHLESFPTPKKQWLFDERTGQSWERLLAIRAVVTKALEEARRADVIGSSLQAAVTLVPGDKQTAEVLQSHQHHLEAIFIVSKCSLEPISEEADDTEDKLIARIHPAPGSKCVRCWHVRESVGTISAHPQICHVCAEHLRLRAGAP